jgi:hypothetical protein
MHIEEHTIFSVKSAKTFLDCGYTMCGVSYVVFTFLKLTAAVGAASARERLDLVLKNAIQNGDIVGPRFLANGKEVLE